MFPEAKLGQGHKYINRGDLTNAKEKNHMKSSTLIHASGTLSGESNDVSEKELITAKKDITSVSSWFFRRVSM